MLFWPSSSTCESAVAKYKVSKSKKRKTRRNKCKVLLNDKSSVAISEMMSKEPVCSPTPEDQPSCEHHSSLPPTECESTTSLDPEFTDITHLLIIMRLTLHLECVLTVVMKLLS